MATVRAAAPAEHHEKFEKVMRAIEAARALAMTEPGASTDETGCCFADAADQSTAPTPKTPDPHPAAGRRLLPTSIAITTALAAILMSTVLGTLDFEKVIAWTPAAVSLPPSTANDPALLRHAADAGGRTLAMTDKLGTAPTPPASAVSDQGLRGASSRRGDSDGAREAVASSASASMPAARSPTAAPSVFTRSGSANSGDASFTAQDEPAPHSNELRPVIASPEPSSTLAPERSADNLDEWANATVRKLLGLPNAGVSDTSRQDRPPETNLPASTDSITDLETLYTLVPVIDTIVVPPAPAAAPAEIGAEQLAGRATELAHPSAPSLSATSMAQTSPTLNAPTEVAASSLKFEPAVSDRPAQNSTLPPALPEQSDASPQDSQSRIESSSDRNVTRVENSTKDSEAELLAIERSEALGRERQRIDALAGELQAAREEIAALKSRIAPVATNWRLVSFGEAKPLSDQPNTGAGLPPQASPSASGVRNESNSSVTPELSDGASANSSGGNRAETDSLQTQLHLADQGRDVGRVLPQDGASQGTTTAAVKPDRLANSLSPPPRPASLPESRLLARAEGLIKEGDISGARLLLERALDSGSSRAAFLLAETYDPRTLAGPHVRAVFGDPAKAQELYRRAYSGGITQAAERLTAR